MNKVLDWNKIWLYVAIAFFVLFICNLISMIKTKPPIIISLMLLITAHNAEEDMSGILTFLVTTGIYTLASSVMVALGIYLKIK